MSSKNKKKTHREIKMESPKTETMKTRWVKCWRCNKWIIGKPVFNKGVKAWNYTNKDGSEHGCNI